MSSTIPVTDNNIKSYFIAHQNTTETGITHPSNLPPSYRSTQSDASTSRMPEEPNIQNITKK